uniref:Uncharacterized protein n=1 Tax=Rhipicephalus microplus TaxID=6941 RepID=A0A6G5AJ29_RHIMP
MRSSIQVPRQAGLLLRSHVMLKSHVVISQLLGSIGHRRCTAQHQIILFADSGSPLRSSPCTTCLSLSRIPFNSILSYKAFCCVRTRQSKNHCGRGFSSFSFREEKCKYCNESKNG